MASKFSSESVSIASGTARSIAILPARACIIAAAASAPGYIVTIISQNLIVFPSWMQFAAPVINTLGYEVAPG